MLLLFNYPRFSILFQTPQTEIEWLRIAEQYETRWNFPHCIVAVDGKHVNIQPPHDCGSYYYNYKNTHSIVLMAVVDANYEFIYVDVGCNGRVSDGGVWGNSTLSKRLEAKTAGVPQQHNAREPQSPAICASRR